MRVSGDQPDKVQYQREFKEGVKLFEKGFKAMQKSKLDAQKEEYEKSMKESLQVIQDTATALMNKKLLLMKQQLAKDYQNYLAHPTDTNANKIQKDIDGLKNLS